ncbi:alpha/beta hydrolase [Streptomyces griseoaurantiacus]|uniref:alpha/beta hydrolase n=1 Tax=Streptomyces griseoaurantiacus TaxID=68213 RepID=UPI002ED28D31|nr:alpha/beta hydrolase [Streptomyces jietaisiensis]
MTVDEIEFPSYEGTCTLRGRTYVPGGHDGPVPVVVASHGMGDSADRLVIVAEWLCRNGFGVVLYDHRNFGPSDGLPRGEFDPVTQCRDMQMALTYAQSHPRFDADRVGLWGTSFSGGHVLALAGYDDRVKAVVAQTPWIAGTVIAEQAIGKEGLASFRGMFHEERRRTLEGKRPSRLKQVLMPHDPPGTFALVDTKEGYDYAINGPAGVPAQWENSFTARSLEHAVEFDVRSYAERIAPPTLMILAGGDRMIPGDMARAFLEEVRATKSLVEIPGAEHHSLYVPGRGFEQSMEAATRWFSEHLA